MHKESACKRYSTRSQPTGNFFWPALYGLRGFCSPSPISVVLKCGRCCSSWLLSPVDNERSIALLVGNVRPRPAGVLAIRKNSLRRQSTSSSRLDDVRPFHRRASSLRRPFLDCMGARVAAKGRLGRRFVPYLGGHANPSAAPTPSDLALVSNSNRDSRRSA